MATIRKHRDKYQVQVRRKGHRPISKTFHHLKDAQEWARWMEVQADRGELPEREPPTPEIKLADLIKKYISEIVPTKKSADNEVIFLGAFLRHKICSKRVDRLRVADFAPYRDERLKTITPSSIKRQLAPISHAFEIARTEWGIPIKENPVEGLRLKARDNRRERRLRDGEYEKLLEAARTRQSPYIEWIVIFAIETAMRRGEILGLHWDQVDFKRRSVII